eukprot:1159008-Pelagomonas_calceolata.AAC.4
MAGAAEDALIKKVLRVSLKPVPPPPQQAPYGDAVAPLVFLSGVAQLGRCASWLMDTHFLLFLPVSSFPHPTPQAPTLIVPGAGNGQHGSRACRAPHEQGHAGPSHRGPLDRKPSGELPPDARAVSAGLLQACRRRAAEPDGGGKPSAVEHRAELQGLGGELRRSHHPRWHCAPHRSRGEVKGVAKQCSHQSRCMCNERMAHRGNMHFMSSLLCRHMESCATPKFEKAYQTRIRMHR